MANNFNEFIDKGHIYRLGKENKFYCAYAVMDRICQVTASITASGLILVYGQHDHEPLFTHLQYRVDALVAELKEKSMRNMFNSLKLLKDEMISCYSDVSHLLPDEVILFNINEARTQHIQQQQRMIRNFQDVETLLSQNDLDWKHYLVDHGIDHCALVITSEEMFHRLGRSTELYVHYKTEHLPDQPRAKELIIISIVHDNTLCPAIYVLLSIRGDFNVYHAVWERLLEFQPELARYLKTVSGEISSSLAAGIISNLPTVEIKYSVVLYMRDIFKEWNLLNLYELPNKLFQYFCGIIFLPQEKWAGIFEGILEQHQLHTERLMILIQRIQEYWFTGRRQLCFRAVTYGANIIPLDSLTSSNLFSFLRNVVERIKTQEEEWITRASSFVKPKRQFLQLTRLRQYLLEEAFTVKDFIKATLNREVTDLISNEIIRNDVIFDNIDLTIPHFENRHQDVARPEEDDTTNGADNDDGAREAVVVNRGNCSICLTASSTIVVLPCFHLCLCMPCNTMMQHHYNRQLAENEALYPTCPVCRTRIDSTREVYTT